MANNVALKSYTYRRFVDTTTTILLPDGKAREYFSIFNEGSNVLFVKLGLNCSLSDYSYQVPVGGTLEEHRWGGPVTGIRGSNSGFAQCTETV